MVAECDDRSRAGSRRGRGGGAAGTVKSPATKHTSASSPLVVGGMFPFTGTKSLLSQWGTHGVPVGIYEVNHNGGVLGHMWKSAYVDDAADSVDALPAFRKLLLKHPTMVIGPFSPTIEAVIGQFKPNNVADFMVGGLTQLDHMNDPYVFRTSSSDSNEAIAMAYYAIHHGWKSASLIFDNSANSQGFVPPLEKAFKALGGKIDANITLTPGQSSYNAELAQAFANHPQVIFDSMDSQSAATLFSDGQQLGYMNVPWIGDDLQSAPNGDYAKASARRRPASSPPPFRHRLRAAGSTTSSATTRRCGTRRRFCRRRSTSTTRSSSHPLQ